jgi:hypothetical protein
VFDPLIDVCGAGPKPTCIPVVTARCHHPLKAQSCRPRNLPENNSDYAGSDLRLTPTG